MNMLDGIPSLLALVFALGLRHGLDADHLAAVDAMARAAATRRPALSRWTGVLFSLGHGGVVTLVATLIGAYAADWNAPLWLEALGSWISIAVLSALGIANLYSAWAAEEGRAPGAVGLKSRLFRLGNVSHPVLMAAVGALFAISFDTLTQTAVFALAAGKAASGGVVEPVGLACALGLVFTLGMAATDGLNGWCFAGLARRAGRGAALGARLMSAAVGLSSLAIAALGVAGQFWPGENFPVTSLGLGAVSAFPILCALALMLAWRPRHSK